MGTFLWAIYGPHTSHLTKSHLLIPPSDNSYTLPLSISTATTKSRHPQLRKFQKPSPLFCSLPFINPCRALKIKNLIWPLFCLKYLKTVFRINLVSLTHLQGCLRFGPTYLLSLILCHFAPCSATATLALFQFLCLGTHCSHGLRQESLSLRLPAPPFG